MVRQEVEITKELDDHEKGHDMLMTTGGKGVVFLSALAADQ